MLSCFLRELINFVVTFSQFKKVTDMHSILEIDVITSEQVLIIVGLGWVKICNLTWFGA